MKTKTLIIIAVIFVAVTILGNRATLYFNLQDTSGVEEGMTFTEYTALIPKEERNDFWNYSFFANNRGFPVLVRCEEDKIVKVEVINASKTSTKESRFEEITSGMTISQVFQMVGSPYGYSKTDDKTLVFISRDETMYSIRFTLTDNILYVESIATESIAQ
ncbi:MAG: hypothetical protein J6Q30_05665 [Oscillospiraceae bacterium]|nr:hypothetical protein [Oscillospiraceae bacterium]